MHILAMHCEMQKKLSCHLIVTPHQNDRFIKNVRELLNNHLANSPVYSNRKNSQKNDFLQKTYIFQKDCRKYVQELLVYLQFR